MSEESAEPPFQFATEEGNVGPGHTRCFELEGRRVLLCNAGGALYAIEDGCTHDRCPLGEGRLRGFLIECPRHGARFDVRDGAVRAAPAIRPVTSFPVRIVDGRVEVRLVPPRLRDSPGVRPGF